MRARKADQSPTEPGSAASAASHSASSSSCAPDDAGNHVQSGAVRCSQVQSGAIRAASSSSGALHVSTAANKASRSRSEDGLDSIARRSTCGEGVAAPW